MILPKLFRRARNVQFNTLIAASMVVIWMLAGITKIAANTDLSKTIHTLFPFSQPTFDHWVSTLVILIDWILAFGFMFPRTRVAASVMQIAICTMFAGFHILRMTDGLTPSCSCFGLAFKPTPLFAIALNLIMIAASASILVHKEKRK